MTENGYDWKITAKKFLIGLGYTLGISALAYTIDFLQMTEFPPEYAFWTGLLLSILIAVQNYLKHRGD